jgi:glycogen(starch) synthase
MEKMRIAFFSIEYPPRVFGGLGVYVDSISSEISALGHQVGIFAFGDPGLKRRQKRQGVTVFRENPLPMRDGLDPFLSPETFGWGEGLDVLLDLLSYNQLAASRLLHEGPFDLCVAHDWLGLPGAMAVKRNSDLPMIFHVHSTEVGRSKAPNQQLVSLEVKGANLADAVITVSRAMKDELVGLGIPKEKIHVCYHGVDSRSFNPGSVKPRKLESLREKYELSENDEVILFLGRLEPVKGIIQLLKAMPMVLDDHPNAKLLIIGRGVLEEQVRSEANLMGNCVKLITDFLDTETKVHHYALADLCVFPSLYEPFGIVALEAAAMEKPAVVGASGVSGLREIVENPGASRPTGVHVNPQDPVDIAWGINTALEDPEQLKVWGKNARERCLSIFTWSRAAEETLEIYREVVSSRS